MNIEAPAVVVVPDTASTVQKEVIDGTYSSVTAYNKVCKLKHELYLVAGGTDTLVESSTWVTFDGATGKLTVDDNTLGKATYKVKVTQNTFDPAAPLIQWTNEFTIEVVCPKLGTLIPPTDITTKPPN